jgi:hypothetical protein
MKPLTFAALLTFCLAADAPAAPTMRVDYYHTGNDREERFSLDRIVVEPLEWPGNPASHLDGTNLGKYFFEVADAETGRALFSRGFNSIYGEWETTAEARTMNRTFSESLRFPAVERPVRIVVRKRDARNVFEDVWSFVVDPNDRFVQRGRPGANAGPLVAIHTSGDPAVKLDLLLLGDGYTAAERSKFERDARRLTAVFLETSPFRERRDDINVWGLVPAAAESGVSRPSQGIHRRSPVGATYDALGTERYILTFENREFRDLAANAPYDLVQILVNGATYGGGGIFGLYSTVAADNTWAGYLFVHEFGHHIAGLADEYYTSDVAYLPAADRSEPWEPNVTALLDPAALKWRDLVGPETPIPTPWPKDDFDRHAEGLQERRRQLRAAGRPESDLDALFKEQTAYEVSLFGASPHAAAVGAFEGANYEARGSFRPEIDCVMFSRNRTAYCRVCRRAIEQVLDFYSRA